MERTRDRPAKMSTERQGMWSCGLGSCLVTEGFHLIRRLRDLFAAASITVGSIVGHEPRKVCLLENTMLCTVADLTGEATVTVENEGYFRAEIRIKISYVHKFLFEIIFCPSLLSRHFL